MVIISDNLLDKFERDCREGRKKGHREFITARRRLFAELYQLYSRQEVSDNLAVIFGKIEYIEWQIRHERLPAQTV